MEEKINEVYEKMERLEARCAEIGTCLSLIDNKELLEIIIDLAGTVIINRKDVNIGDFERISKFMESYESASKVEDKEKRDSIYSTLSVSVNGLRQELIERGIIIDSDEFNRHLA